MEIRNLSDMLRETRETPNFKAVFCKKDQFPAKLASVDLQFYQTVHLVCLATFLSSLWIAQGLLEQTKGRSQVEKNWMWEFPKIGEPPSPQLDMEIDKVADLPVLHALN